MRYMATYDLMETMRNTNQWLGASAKAVAAYPAMSLVPNPFLQWVGAWGEVTERSFARMAAKPDWGIQSIPAEDGRDHVISVESVVSRPFKYACSWRSWRPVSHREKRTNSAGLWEHGAAAASSMFFVRDSSMACRATATMPISPNGCSTRSVDLANMAFLKAMQRALR